MQLNVACSVSPSTITTNSFTSRSSLHDILLPEFAHGIVFHPRREGLRVKPLEFGPSVLAIDDDDLLGSEVIEKGRRLCRNDDLVCARKPI